MEREIDLAPRQLLDWLKAGAGRDGSGLEVRATREFLAEPVPATAGLDAEDDMVVLTTVGLLEVAPRAGGAHWVLRLRVEDGVGSHLPEDGSVPDGPEEIRVETFETCFLTAEAAVASVTVETGSAADGRAFQRILARMLSVRPGAGRSGAAGAR